MTENEAKEAVLARFVAEWVSGPNPLTPYAFDRETFAEPASGPWARLTVKELLSRQKTMGAPGARLYARKIVITIDIFDDPAIGTQRMDGLAKTARELWEGRKFGGTNNTSIIVRDVQKLELATDGKWQMTSVQATAEVYETK